jgi:hypothetical protein
LGVQLGARYDGSSIVVADGTPPADDFIVYRPSSVPGGRAPHAWLDESHDTGASLYDRLAPGFTLLRLGRPRGDSLLAAAAALRIPMAALDVADADVRELYGCDLALIRPDQHVAWRGDADPADATRIMRHVSGA